ncbi:hypothetical protein SAMN04488026_11494 [Aliiruegeria lutimaris]|uniref:Uncharacterized protein n=1 Tax=Aliiruegeria lutimaris TaxID=571298 RepID=A0A1G9PVE5_9RHOB|nr:hypothetical protein SAMN04488026_11494 [Aliiruegeria lutimaris]
MRPVADNAHLPPTQKSPPWRHAVPGAPLLRPCRRGAGHALPSRHRRGFAPYAIDAAIGAETLNWIVAPWSLRLGARGYAVLLAARAYPAYRATVPVASGVAAGIVDGPQGDFFLCGAGNFKLEITGWFRTETGTTSWHSRYHSGVPAEVPCQLPPEEVVSLMQRSPNDFEIAEDWHAAGVITGAPILAGLPRQPRPCPSSSQATARRSRRAGSRPSTTRHSLRPGTAGFLAWLLALRHRRP